jgi:hypothetical protein
MRSTCRFLRAAPSMLSDAITEGPDSYRCDAPATTSLDALGTAVGTAGCADAAAKEEAVGAGEGADEEVAASGGGCGAAGPPSPGPPPGWGCRSPQPERTASSAGSAAIARGARRARPPWIVRALFIPRARWPETAARKRHHGTSSKQCLRGRRVVREGGAAPFSPRRRRSRSKAEECGARWLLAQPSVPGGETTGSPNTFLFGFASGDESPSCAEEGTCEVICTTVQRGASGEVADATIWAAHPDRNEGGSTYAFSGLYGGSRKQALFRFALDAIPAHATVTSARLGARVYGPTGQTLRAHRITAPWQERSVTWRSFAASYDEDAAASLTDVTEDAAALDVTALVQAWVGGALPNHGLLLEGDPAQQTSYRSSEHPRLEDHPRLEVCYFTP